MTSIIVITDAYDAMTSDWCYRPHLGVREACSRLKQRAGSQFDPALMDVFVQITEELSDTERYSAFAAFCQKNT